MASSMFEAAASAAASDSRSNSGGALRPFFTVDQSKEDDLLRWLESARDASVKYASNRNRDIKMNIDLYAARRQGVSDISAPVSRLDDIQIERSRSDLSSVIVNHLYDLTEGKVATFVNYRPEVDVSPRRSTDPAHRLAASANKDLITYWRDTNNLDGINERFARHRTIAGEAYLFVEWDPEKGYIHPEVESITQAGLQPADSFGNPVDPETKVGDVSFRIPDTRNIFPEAIVTGEFNKTRYLFERELCDLDELKADYPALAAKIESTTEQATPFLYGDSGVASDAEDYAHEIDTSNLVEVWNFWHKGTKYVPGGRKIKFVKGLVLENGPSPYEGGIIPVVRVTDIDVDGRLYGSSMYSQIRGLNEFINKLYSTTYRNQLLVGNPKWFVHENARVNSESLGNGITIVKYSGDKMPELAAFPNTPKEVFGLIQSMENAQQKFAKSSDLSRGQVPPGIEAAAAFRFLAEQDQARRTSEVLKQNNFIKSLWEMALGVARQFYSPTDERLLKIWGQDQSFEIKALDPLHLSTPCEVRIQPSSSMSDSKALRTQTIMEIDQRRPLPDDAFYGALDLGIPDLVTNEMTYARKSADLENTLMASGQPVPPPMPGEDDITHWHRHFIFRQTPTFLALPPELRAPHDEHLLITERNIYSRAYLNDDPNFPVNQALAQVLLQMPAFPALYRPNLDMMQMQAQAMMMQTAVAPQQIAAQTQAATNEAQPETESKSE